MPRPRGDTDLTASQVLDGLAAVDAAHRAERRRGRPTEEDYAGGLAVSRRTLHAYRRRFGIPRRERALPERCPFCASCVGSLGCMRVNLSEPAVSALTRLAVSERRDARDQAAVLIERELRREGLLPGEQHDASAARTSEATP